MGYSKARQLEDRSEMIALIRQAIERDIDFFDTAEAYGPFTDEVMVGEALKPLRDQVLMATKFGWNIDPDTGVRHDGVVRHNPAVTVRIREPRIGATARVLDGEIDRELWDQVAAIADRKYGWGDGLPVEITPTVPRTADPVITVNPSDGPCAARAKTT